MKKARLENGEVVLAHQFNKAARGDTLLCADPSCGAHMGFRREALTHGSQFIKSACFFSKDANEHVADCSAYEPFSIQAKRRNSIEEALKSGDNILLNLNMNMTLAESFNQAAARDVIGVASTHQLSKYAAVGVKSVEDILDCIDTIKKKGGQKGLGVTFVNYQGKVSRLDDFIIDSKQKYEALLNKMADGLKKSGTAEAFTGEPCLIDFKATLNTRAEKSPDIRGTHVKFYKRGGKALILLQKIKTRDEFSKTLRGENLHLVARPTLTRREAEYARRNLQAGKDAFLNIHWEVGGAHQFMPIEPPAAPAQPELKL